MEPAVIAVPSGRVTVSDRRTQRSWSVDLTGFLLASTPATQATYEAVTGQRPSSGRGDRLPVEGVSWWDAPEFCNALSDRDGLGRAYERDWGSPGIIMGVMRCTADEAFLLLTKQSQVENRRLRDIAAEIVSRTKRPD